MNTYIIWKGLHCFIPNVGEMHPDKEYCVDAKTANVLVDQGKAEFRDTGSIPELPEGMDTTEEEG